MLTLIASIAAAVAIGMVVAHVVKLTLNWIKNRIKQKMAAKNVKKTAVADIEELIANCDNTVSMSELEKMTDEGYSHVMVSVDENNKVVGDVEMIEDTNDTLDREVEQLLGRQRMVVVEG